MAVDVVTLIEVMGALVAIVTFVLWLLQRHFPHVLAIPVGLADVSTAWGAPTFASWTWSETVDQYARKWTRGYSVVFTLMLMLMAFAGGLMAGDLTIDPAIVASLFFGSALTLLGLVVLLVRYRKTIGARAARLRIGEL